MYNETTFKFPEPKLLLGQYLVPVINVGYTMIPNILKKTGEVVPQFILCSLTMKELQNSSLKEQCHNFDEATIAKIGYSANETYFLDEELTPTYDFYVNYMTEVTPNAPDKDLKPTPEASDNYVISDVMFTCGGTLPRERVIGRKLDANGNPVDQSNV